MLYRSIKSFKIKDVLYPVNSLLNLPGDKAQILLNKNLIQPITFNELHQALTKELKDYGGRGMLIKFNILDENIALTTPEHFEELKREGYIVYLPEELITLLIAKPETLEVIHEIKKVFEGKIMSAHAEGKIDG